MYLQNIWLWVFLALHIKYCSVYIYTQKSVGSVPFLEFGSCVAFGLVLGLVGFLKPELCSLVFSLFLAMCSYLPYFLSQFFYFSFLHSFFPSFQILLKFSFVFFWFSLAFFCVLSIASSLDLFLFFFSFSFGFDFLAPPTPTLLFQDRVFVGILWFLTV